MKRKWPYILVAFVGILFVLVQLFVGFIGKNVYLVALGLLEYKIKGNSDFQIESQNVKSSFFSPYAEYQVNYTGSKKTPLKVSLSSEYSVLCKGVKTNLLVKEADKTLLNADLDAQFNLRGDIFLNFKFINSQDKVSNDLISSLSDLFKQYQGKLNFRLNVWSIVSQYLSGQGLSANSLGVDDFYFGFKFSNLNFKYAGKDASFIDPAFSLRGSLDQDYIKALVELSFSGFNWGEDHFQNGILQLGIKEFGRTAIVGLFNFAKELLQGDKKDILGPKMSMMFMELMPQLVKGAPNLEVNNFRLKLSEQETLMAKFSIKLQTGSIAKVIGESGLGDSENSLLKSLILSNFPILGRLNIDASYGTSGNIYKKIIRDLLHFKNLQLASQGEPASEVASKDVDDTFNYFLKQKFIYKKGNLYLGSINFKSGVLTVNGNKLKLPL